MKKKNYVGLLCVALGMSVAYAEEPENQQDQLAQIMYVQRSSDLTLPIKYLAAYRSALDNIIKSVVEYSAQVAQNLTQEQDVVQSLDGVVADSTRKFGSLNEELPDYVMYDIFQSLEACQAAINKDLEKNPVNTANDYLAFMKRCYTNMFIGVVTVLHKYYELTDEAIAPYVQQF